MQQLELLFGRNVGMRVGISRSAFQRFLAREVTPRFPEGLTVLDSVGAWRDAGEGRGQTRRRGEISGIAREPGQVVIIVAPDVAKTYEDAADIAAAYKRQFRQHSVGIVARPVCATF